ncbi:ABC transporter ATP-binding protein [Rhodococcus qingshengii]|jgi:branched-chain amino acid transport system ATP-binding protein|uniref:ABC transporter ATP-binding protein n=4 Tax=Mycobacteriales TaxID=85007 RepID=A0A0E4A4D5_RHOER|nr:MULTISPECIES: ATP-binding cassette domain-containing protein [Rhodococcus]ERB54250.1 ABC transporter ATP-binding protein [Rhodococcus sp. P27]AGT91361.1 ABC transporter ATP-binding protein [Rhodococcus erythropolis CCM2595]AKD96658.1 ABC transporter ATP-binding protein [Rhodococcus erythropolis]AUS31048.1 ABC transporter ATP-binding protein [Rhodococcus qingshengii]AZI61042.1 ATP-binding cassette domain-containing protein [Rhodococcus sp. NJ-530]
MLELDRVTVRYGSAVAVREVSLVAPAGEVTAIVGPNGAGKTSLAGSIYGSVPATGTIKFDGREIQKLSALDRVRSGFAYVPQGRQLFMRMSVRENLRVGADLLGLKAEAVETAFERFPILRERSESYAGVLSGGEQQMLVLGRALLETPKVLLLDEMMTGLAPKIVAELRALVGGLAAEGVTVIVTEPALTALKSVVDRGYVMQRGELVRECDSAATLDNAYKQSMGVLSADGR